MSKANWIFRNGVQSVDCTSFPFAFRAMYNVVRKGQENKQPVNTKELTILGPEMKGERQVYSYFAATQLAQDQGLLTPQGEINSREFKRR